MRQPKTAGLNIIIALFILFLSSTLLYAGEINEITVSAAISLKSAFTEIAREYEREHPEDRVLINFASSGLLMKQIEQGAYVDIFASASTREVDQLEEAGFIIKGSRGAFASNSLVIITEKNIESVEALLGDEFRTIAIGNPATVPVGRYAKESLSNSGVYDALKEKLVFCENARQVLNYVVRGEVDAAVLYKSDALLIRERKYSIFTVDNASHEMITYPIAAVKGTKIPGLAMRFINFTGSERAAQILDKYGFQTR